MKNISGCILLGVMFLCACTQSGVDQVKKGFFADRQAVCVEDVFEGSFTDGQWEEFDSDSGKHVVEFTGRISGHLHRRAVDLATEKVIVEIAKAMAEGNPFPLIGLAAKSREFTKMLGKSGEKELERSLLAKGVSKDAIGFLALSELYDRDIWGEGAEVTVQWVKNLKSGTYELAYLGGSSWDDFDSDAIVRIICGEHLERVDRKVQVYLDNKMAEMAAFRDIFQVEMTKILNPVPRDQGLGTGEGVEHAMGEVASWDYKDIEGMAADFASLNSEGNRFGEWVLAGYVKTSHEKAFRVINDDAFETSSRMGANFLILDYDKYGRNVPSINIAASVVSSTEELMEMYGGMHIYNVVIDSRNVGRIEFRGEPTEAGSYVYMEYNGCPNILKICKEMETGGRIEFFEDDSDYPEFYFDLSGYEKIGNHVSKAVKDISDI